jgi:anti-anti-sigma factor
MSHTLRHEGPVSIIKIQGRFVFSEHQAFRDTYTPLIDRAETKVIRLDLSAVNFIDSSTLGMLLLMRERAQPVGKSIELVGANETVIKLLKIANFHKMFSVQGA